MARLRWTLQALDDLESICTHIARDSDHYARMFAQRVIERASTLEAFPHAGRIVPELQLDNVREILHGNYRIIYRQTDDSVQILTVHHSARLLDSSQFEAG